MLQIRGEGEKRLGGASWLSVCRERRNTFLGGSGAETLCSASDLVRRPRGGRQWVVLRGSRGRGPRASRGALQTTRDQAQKGAKEGKKTFQKGQVLPGAAEKPS